MGLDRGTEGGTCELYTRCSALLLGTSVLMFGKACKVSTTRFDLDLKWLCLIGLILWVYAAARPECGCVAIKFNIIRAFAITL